MNLSNTLLLVGTTLQLAGFVLGGFSVFKAAEKEHWVVRGIDSAGRWVKERALRIKRPFQAEDKAN